MKHFLLKSLLAIAVLCAGSGSVWAETIATMGSTTAGWGENYHSYTLGVNKTLTLTFNITATAGGDFDGHYVNITQNGDKMGIQPGGGFYYYGDEWWNESHIASTAISLDDYKTVLPGSSVKIKVRRFGTQIDYFVEINKEATRLYRRLVTTSETFNASADINIVLGADHAVFTNIIDVTTDESTLGTLLGQEDNSGGFGAGARKDYTIAANGSLTLHFTNYNNQINPWNNWAFEMEYGGKYADIVTGGGNWGDLLVDAGLAWDGSSTYPSNYLSTMDGADILLTIEREGAKVTATSVGKAKDGSTWTTKYSFTPSTETYPSFATSDVTFRLLTEGGHMDLLPITNYTVKAYDGSSNLLKEITSGTWNSGRSVTVGYPQYVLSGTTLYNIPNNSSDWFHTTFSPLTDDYEKQLVYNGTAVENVVFYVEGEDIEGITQTTPSSTRTSCGKSGYTIHYNSGDELYREVTTLPAGSYIIYTRCVAGSSERALKIKVGDDVKLNTTIQNGTNLLKNTGAFTITESSTVSVSLVGSNNDGLDWLYIQKTAVPVTLGSIGWATLYTPYALNFSTTGLTAYTATLSEGIVTLNEVENVPANTGVVLNGAAGSYNIPTVASSDTPQGELTGNATESTAYNAEAGHTYYVLASSEDANYKVQFRPVTSGSIAAGKAFLDVAGGGVKAFNVVFNDLATGINELANGQQPMANGPIFNLAGQRVDGSRFTVNGSGLKTGIYIVNGKKVLVK